MLKLLFTRKTIILLIIFLLTFIVSATFSAFDVDPHHDGILFKPAADVANGKILFKDTFSIYGALTTFIQALTLKLFGNYLLNLRILTSLFYALISALLWLTWVKFLKKPLALAAIIVWLLLAHYYSSISLEWPSVYALFFQCLSLYLFIIFCEKEQFFQKIVKNPIRKKINLYLFLIGIMTSLTFWCKQPVGLFLFLAFFITFLIFIFLKIINLKKGLINLFFYLVGFSIINFIFLLYFKINNSFKDWFLQSLVYPYLFGERFGGYPYNVKEGIKNLLLIDNHIRTFSDPSKILSLLYLKISSNSSMIFTALPLISVAIFCVAFYLLFFRREKNKTNVVMLGISLICIASWMQYYPVPSGDHLYWAATPMIGLFFYSLFRIFNRFIKHPALFKRNRQLNISLWFTIFLFYFLSLNSLFFEIKSKLESGIDKLNKDYVVVKEPEVLRGIKVDKQTNLYYSDLFKEVSRNLQQYPGKNLILFGCDGLYLTLFQQSKNIHQIYEECSYYKHIYPELAKVYVSYINKSKPLILVLNFGLDSDLKSFKNYNFIAQWKKQKVSLMAPIEK